MNKVYIVINNWHLNYGVVGCFSTLEKANAFIKQMNIPKDFSIQEMEIK